jgi:hypothetical protein
MKQLIMQTVNILQFDSAGTDSLPKGGFLHGNPNLLRNNLARHTSVPKCIITVLDEG